MEIRITGLKKYYKSEGNVIKALDDVNLVIPSNRIFTLLGPSGCGKTTLLRSIVGLEAPDEGEIQIGDTVVWSSSKNIFVPTEKRALGMVFQTYAIWPHMNVFNNIAYPLQNQKRPKDEIESRVREVLKFVQLEGFEKRPATRLSGGQQQRVALARALVAKPKVILFDEPLSNLDAKLREETRKELRSFLTELEITAVYVTHDRVEALALSDNIGVMRSGKIIEIGEPKKIYFHPEHQFVADFIGRSNLIPASIQCIEGGYSTVTTDIGKFVCSDTGIKAGSSAVLCIRPEFVEVASAEEPRPVNAVEGVVHSMVFIGEVYESEIKVNDRLVMVKLPADTKLSSGDPVTFHVKPEHCLLVSE
ncbi:MAG: ABC transporter ATP-binding protein [Sphaerochaetaceae bacterium]|jgi:iron(III) transport system ATP-binding protein|nr:ABC transporter ATP-binding protein [Sphaerochaetaceae bacterium]MDD3163959.1 ABC transporter ATP-binding protein [Sphaerochaetaceae bacterium]MDD4008097.1 ABC transporter ATP-binding protein [Sphaerochaetaceae bacterium]MDD4397424.1 ABC transporter ATP-binding protein [Sphaerochaetaceae bacterium]